MDAHRARCGLLQTGEHAQHRRLAATEGPSSAVSVPIAAVWSTRWMATSGFRSSTNSLRTASSSNPAVSVTLGSRGSSTESSRTEFVGVFTTVTSRSSSTVGRSVAPAASRPGSTSFSILSGSTDRSPLALGEVAVHQRDVLRVGRGGVLLVDLRVAAVLLDQDRDDGLRVRPVVLDAAEQAGDVAHEQVAVLVDPRLRREEDVAVGRRPKSEYGLASASWPASRSWIGWLVT